MCWMVIISPTESKTHEAQTPQGQDPFIPHPQDIFSNENRQGMTVCRIKPPRDYPRISQVKSQIAL